MTRDQFIATILRAADQPAGGALDRFLREKADHVYDPALEDNDRMQFLYAVRRFSGVADSLCALVEKLHELSKERQS